ncbi:GntR family transcriptional regulator [Mycobacterium sp. 21AC1]|uniref:GntR family transcriptional regulator n=1 Tax=[Mycobacterium] appelbergii TaxID=2939269 RepID=UPI0029392EEC|nr:GntR family transcriptional regulator [Mycobacterium sp. 21AC1]MDV3125862.1 GntR family transcriptional regulator [Mycobacterium sp. 21AC1]
MFDPGQVSLTDRVYDELMRAIRAGELQPGTMHSVVEISGRLGVSRTPVREALLRMASNGMVRFERSRGVRILEVSTRDIEEIYSLRMLLEVPSAYRAAELLTDELLGPVEEAFDRMRKAAEAGDESLFQAADVDFHAAILNIAGNRRVTEVAANTRIQMMDRGLSTTATRTLADILLVHERILNAIRDRDPQASGARMRDHLVETVRLLLTQSTGDDASANTYVPPPLPVP